MPDKKNKEFTYYVKGMHCSSCEILIEKKLLEQGNFKSVEAKAGKGEVLVEYQGERPAASDLSQLFKKENYSFFEQPQNLVTEQKNDWGFILIGGAFLIIVFLGFNRLGLGSLFSVNSSSLIPAFVVFGLLAGVSSCAALVGGIVLSMSKQWNQLYAEKNSTMQKLEPHLLFNLGRIISFAFFGGLLGVLGQKLNISLFFTTFLVLAVSVLMLFMGLQMLGLKYFQKFQVTTPKFATRFIANEKNFQGRLTPFVLGALTFFLPCGFTITTQGLALLSGGLIQGAGIMTAFVLGTTPVLLGIGFSSIKISSNPNWGNRFTKIAGILVLFFALFNINSQLNVLGITSFDNLNLKKTPLQVSTSEDGFPPIIEGKQIIKMDASATGYTPNFFKVKVGTPVRWEITDRGTSGCTNAIISRGLFDEQIDLHPGLVSVKEFTPQKPGKYKFSCWMGMVSGTIEVVNLEDSSATSNSISVVDQNQTENIISSGASGCGCGGN